MRLYWASAIIQDGNNKKPCLCAVNDAKFTFDGAMEVITFLKNNYTVLSAWIDMYEDIESKVKQTVFHECYIDSFGYVRQ